MMYFKDRSSSKRVAYGLGWASMGIGTLELLAPQYVEKMLGIDQRSTSTLVIRAMGIRELLHGISLLTRDPERKELSAALWTRVAGDVLDTALLGVAATKTKAPVKFTTVATIVSMIGLLDTIYAKRLARD
jgi:hypothetical protein